MLKRARGLGVKYASVLLATSVCGTAFADQYHYNNVLIGDRAAGMGGAYVGVADDTAGLYYNPAGIVYAGGSGFSASANAFHMTTTRYKKVLGGSDWERSSQVLLPNFFGMIQPLGPGMAGFSYAVVDSSLEDQDQTFADTPAVGNSFNINFNNQDNTYNIGPSYAFEITKRLAIGVTLYGHYRKQDLIFNQQYILRDDDYTIDPVTGQRQFDPSTPDTTDFLKNSANKVVTNHWVNKYSTITEYGIKPMLGIMISPMDKISLGISVSQTVLMSSTAKIQDTCYTTDFDGVTEEDPTTLEQSGICQYNKVQRSNTTENIKRDFPLTMNAGIAYFASPALLLSGSVSVYQGMYGNTQPLINYAGGMEYYVNGQWAIRAGAFTNFANTPTLVEGYAGQFEHVDLFGGSFSITNFTRTTSISVGMSVSGGTGQAQVIGGNSNIQDTEILAATGFISTAYSF